MDSRAGRVLKQRASERSSTPRSGTGSSSTPTGDFDHLLIATTVPWPALARPPPPRRLERRSRRRLAGSTARGGRKAAPRGRLRPLGLLRRLLPGPARAARRGRLRQARRGAGLDRRPLRRRPSRLPGRDRTSRPGQGSRARSTRRLLALSQPARRPRATRDQDRLLAAVRRRDARPGQGRRRTRPGPALAPGRGALFDNQVATLRLDGREASMKLDKPSRGRRGALPLSTASSSAASPEKEERPAQPTASAQSRRRSENCGVAALTSTTSSAGTFALLAAARIASGDGAS